MPDDRLLKQVACEIMEGSNRRGRPERRWTDDVEECRNNDLHTQHECSRQVGTASDG